MVTRMIIPETEKPFTYETERASFIGRNNSITNPNALDEKLTNYAGDNLDPVLALRNEIVVPANEQVAVYLFVGFGRSKEQINENIKYIIPATKYASILKSSDTFCFV